MKGNNKITFESSMLPILHDHFFFFACQRIIPTSFQQFLVNFPTFWNYSSMENKHYIYIRVIWISHGLRCIPFSIEYFCHLGQSYMTSHLVVVVEASWWLPLCMYLQGLIHLRLQRTFVHKVWSWVLFEMPLNHPKSDPS